MILKFLANSGRFIPLDSNCKFTLDSINFEEKMNKRVFKSRRLPSEGRFRINYEEMESRLKDDFYYIENLSLKFDFEIIIRTVWCVIIGHGQT